MKKINQVKKKKKKKKKKKNMFQKKVIGNVLNQIVKIKIMQEEIHVINVVLQNH
jgi:hypothetical protein